MPFTRKELFEVTHFPAVNRPKTGSEDYSERVVNELFAAFKSQDETLDEDSFKSNPLVIKEAKYFTGEVKVFWKESKSNKKWMYKNHDEFFSHVIDFSEENLMDVDEALHVEEQSDDEELRAANEVEQQLFDDLEEELDPHHFVNVEEEMDVDVEYFEGNAANIDATTEPTDQEKKFKGKHRTTKYRVGKQFRDKFGKEAVWIATKQQLRGSGNWAAIKAFDDIKEDKELAKKVCAFIKTIKNKEEKPKVDATDCLALLYDRDFSERDWNVSSLIF